MYRSEEEDRDRVRGNAGLRVRLAGDADLRSWQEFVDRSPAAGCMHHAGWLAVLREAYWVAPHFFMAVDGEGAIRGILPTYLGRSIIAGSYVSSLEDGILSADPQAARLLLASAFRLRDQSGAGYLQIRGGPVDETPARTVPTVRTVITTRQPPDALWAAVKKKTRWAVRQAEKLGIGIEFDPTLSALAEFYSNYAAHMRDLGTPVIGFDAFEAIRTHLGADRLRLYLVRWRGKVVGGMLCITNGDRWTDYFAIVRPLEDTEFANYLLYWHVIRDAAAQGAVRLDLGRSTPHSNVHLFKRKWGGTDAEVTYHFYPAPNRREADMGLQRLRERKGLPQRLWSNLPLGLCNRLGPLLRKQLPFI